MFRFIYLSLAALGVFACARADEGAPPPASKQADLSTRPLTALAALPGCSATFVSPGGLAVTNRHCISVQLPRNGYLAKTRTDELPGGPKLHMYVTEKSEDVTERVLKDLAPGLAPRERRELVQGRIRQLVAECEADDDKTHRCKVVGLHQGAAWARVRQLVIRDVRIAYAPADGIGNFGGDVNMNDGFPRHTGDFAFVRAYVGKDGRPAEPAPDNIPYRPRDFLAVSAEGVRDGDAVTLAGYPGRAGRYRVPAEIRYARDVEYPARLASVTADLCVIAAATMGSEDDTRRYAGVSRSLNNLLVKTRGQLDGVTRPDLGTVREQQDAKFRAWYKEHGGPRGAKVVADVDAAIAADMALAQQEAAWAEATHSDLLHAARTLYRLALERQKPDAQRAEGYQDKDLAFIKGRLARQEQAFAPGVDQARYAAALLRYVKLDARSRPAGLDGLLPVPNGSGATLPALYKSTELADTGKRLAWLGREPDAFRKSADPFIQLAVRLNDVAQALEERRREVDASLRRAFPPYLNAVAAWRKSEGMPPGDANGLPRISRGVVGPYAPRDGLMKGPFSTVDGLLREHTGRDPYNAPASLLRAIRARRYGPFRDPVLGSVPVDFLSSADAPGANVGAAVLNRRGELVGLNFDAAYEPPAKDWHAERAGTRAVHVDARYMLWVMREVDHADKLLGEMTIRYPKQ